MQTVLLSQQLELGLVHMYPDIFEYEGFIRIPLHCGNKSHVFNGSQVCCHHARVGRGFLPANRQNNPSHTFSFDRQFGQGSRMEGRLVGRM